MPEYPMSAETFRAYLQSLPQDTPFAEARNCSFCPLYAWLTARGVAVQKVFRHNIQIAGRDYHLPYWAQRFVILLDDFHAPSADPLVTPALALRVLDAAVAQTGGDRHVA